MSKIVFLDLETTGLDPRKQEILEVAMLVREGRHDREVYFTLPIALNRADSEALKINRYFQRVRELTAAAIPRVRALALFEVYFRDAIVVGNNVQFDLRFIEQFILDYTRGNQDPTPWHYHPVDLKALVAGTYQLGEPPWSTKQVAEAVGVPLPRNAHTAMADAEWNRDVYDAIYPNLKGV
jgi:DNA polymerase III alpha subunit (gram-positive type)